MERLIGLVSLTARELPCRDGQRESEECVEPTMSLAPGDTPPSHLSPLGALYRREYHRLSRRFPALDESVRDQLIVCSFARLFLDADDAELARAMVEGSPRLYERTGGHVGAYVLPLAQMALDAARPREPR